MDQLFDADRQSLLDEITEHRTLVNKMQNDTLAILEQLEKSKADALQQCELCRDVWAVPVALFYSNQ